MNELLQAPTSLPIESPSGRACRNCAAELVGPFCARCGQRDSPTNPTMRELAGDLWDQLVSIDGKVLLTLRTLLLRPGKLTLDFLAGRRASYVSPLRIYLLVSVLYFLLLAAISKDESSDLHLTTQPNGVELRMGAGDSAAKAARAEEARRADSVRKSRVATAARDSTPVRRTRPGWEGTLDSAWRARKSRAARVMDEDPSAWNRSFREQMPRMMFCMVPVLALLLRVTYRSRRWNVPAHMIAALHAHAFVFAVSLLAELVGLATGDDGSAVINLVAFLWIAWYLTRMLRTVYGGRLSATLARGVVIGVGYGTVGILGLVVTVFVALATL